MTPEAECTLKILHVSKDDKFVDRALYFFGLESQLLNHCALFIEDSGTRRYVESQPNHTFRYSEVEQFAQYASYYDVVVFHSLPGFLLPSLELLDRRIRVVWIGWGYDYYDLLYPSKYNMMLPETWKIYTQQVTSLSIETVKHQMDDFAWRDKKLKIIERVDYFCPVLACEYKMLRNVGMKGPKYQPWNYTPVFDYKELQVSSTDKVNRVFVGNSADPTNNHLDVLEILRRVDAGSRVQLVLPLSYGNQKYSGIVEARFNDSFPESCLFLKDFIPFDEYLSLLKTGKSAIMGHIRQQAMGNIYLMLKTGIRLFLHESSPAYSFLVEREVCVNTLKDLAENPALLTKPLESHFQWRNYELVSRFSSMDNTALQTRGLAQTLIKDVFGK